MNPGFEEGVIVETCNAMDAGTRNHLILSFLLSLLLTFTLGVLYLIYPHLMAMVIAQVGQGPGGSGISSGGGAHFSHAFVLSRVSLIAFLLLISPGLFVFGFLVFQRLRTQLRRK